MKIVILPNLYKNSSKKAFQAVIFYFRLAEKPFFYTKKLWSKKFFMGNRTHKNIDF